jgi:SAM-dependent methyltransferase
MCRGSFQVSQTFERHIQDLGRAARKLAVIGASLKLQSGAAADPAIRDLIDTGARLALGGSPSALSDTEVAQLRIMAKMAFAEGGDLLRNPGRAAGWTAEDPHLLQSIGRASGSAFNRILCLAETRPSLRETLRGRFLDVGTGVGGIALKAAEACPDLQVEGIDLWDFALSLAEQNIAASPHAGRIRLSHLDVTALGPGPRYTLVWLPTMFMPRRVVEQALDRILAASQSGAWLVAALYTTPDDPFMATMSTLRTLRGGGEVTDPLELEDMLRSRGYVDVELDAAPLATFALGRLP